MPTGTNQTLEPMKIAWAAGFLDGEGYIGVTRNFNKRNGRMYYRIDLNAAQVHLAPMELLKSMFGGRVNFHQNKHQGYWYWRVYGEEARQAIVLLLPYLVVKRKQADMAMQFDAVSQNKPGGRKGHFSSLSEDSNLLREALWKAICVLNGGRALRVERLSGRAPTAKAEGDATVRPHGNRNHESRPEMGDRLALVS